MKDSGNRWIKRMFRCLKEKGFAQCPSEPTLWLKPGKGYLIVYVDDVLWVSCGEGIQSEIDAIFAELKVGKTQILDIDARNNDKQDSFRFLGTSLFRTSDGHIEIDMNDAAQKISPIEIDKELKKQKDLKVPEKLVTHYRSLIGKISWLAMSVKPGLTTVSSMYAGRVPGVTVRDILELNAIVEKIDKSNNRLRFVNLHLDSCDEVFLYVYSDASLANRRDTSTQAGYCIFMGQDYRIRTEILVNIISWSSRKLRRITRSTFGSELLSLDEAVDRAVYLKHLLENIFKSVRLVFLLDCKSICSNIFSLNPQVTEQRLRPTLNGIKQTLEIEKADMFHVNGDKMAADVLTKVLKPNNYLKEILRSNKIDTSTFNKVDHLT